MCTVSNNIKFCTCAANSPEKLRHYWILHRFNKDKNERIIGEPHFPDDMFVPDYATNRETLRKRLNQPDAFDFETAFKPKDTLEVTINHDGHPATYCFVFAKDQWRDTEYDAFGLMNHYAELQFGKLKHPIKNRFSVTKPEQK